MTRLPVLKPNIDLCFRDISGRLRTATFSSGRRQWAQPSRVCTFRDSGLGLGPQRPFRVPEQLDPVFRNT